MSGHEERITLYLRGMPAGIVREAKARAARRGSTLAVVVADALARSFEETGARDVPDRELEASMDWYEENRTRLLRRYENEFVAIAGRRVVDHDRDFATLADRVFRRLGVRPVFMPRVLREAETVRVRSPRVGRA